MNFNIAYYLMLRAKRGWYLDEDPLFDDLIMLDIK